MDYNDVIVLPPPQDWKAGNPSALSGVIPARAALPLAESEIPAVKTKRAGLGKGLLKSAEPYLFIGPAFLFILFWLYRPLLGNFYYAFTKWAMVSGTRPQWVGASNFLRFLGNKDFGIALSNTLFYILGLLPFSVALPLLLAVLTNRMSPKAKNIYRIILFIPMIMTPVSTAAIWRWMLHPGNGLVNHALRSLGITASNVA
ncbi:MAG: sugar ABC transporter permease, partial [Treponema sp.]|nr:sugar ABC transporter permease [Treponema sp.]